MEGNITNIFLKDFDKDHDGVWDVNDLFPLNGYEWLDDDNDNVGNNSDCIDGDDRKM